MGDVAQIRYDADSRKPCKYGRNCYRKNKQHLKEFKHQPFKKLTEVSNHHVESPILDKLFSSWQYLPVLRSITNIRLAL